MLPAVALAAVMAAGCARSPRTVAPTGWRSFGEPYDSLTLLLETGFVGDAGADSLGNMARRLAEAAAAPGAPDGLEGRGDFLRGGGGPRARGPPGTRVFFGFFFEKVSAGLLRRPTLVWRFF